MLGFKIFDNDSPEILNKNIQFCFDKNLCLEIAFYNKNQDFFLAFLKNHPLFHRIKKKSIHLNYKNYIGGHLSSSPESVEKMMLEINWMKQLGIQDAVIHYQRPDTFKEHLFQLEPEQLINNLKLIDKIAQDNHIRIYIENTYIYKRKDVHNDLEFHQIIWNSILDIQAQSRVGICLDWGHVKCFSNDSLEDWLIYCKKLKEKNMIIYMHIHDNDTLKDLHLTLPQAKSLQYQSSPEFIILLKKYQKFFEDDILILENQSDIAIQEYQKLMSN